MCIGGIALAVLMLILIVLPFLINVNRFRPKVESEASTALGRQVTVGNLSLSLLSGRVGADRIAIADEAIEEPPGQVEPNTDRYLQKWRLNAFLSF